MNKFQNISVHCLFSSNIIPVINFEEYHHSDHIVPLGVCVCGCIIIIIIISTNRSIFQVKIWFQNRRMKWKRSKKQKDEVSCNQAGSEISNNTSSDASLLEQNQNDSDDADVDVKVENDL